MRAIALSLAFVLFCGASASRASDTEAAIAEVLDELHRRAAAADYQGYFELFHSRAVFLGTDREEYWPLEAFKAYTRARFEQGQGWTYQPTQRFIHSAGDSAWFEERLQHARYGEMRGTGVLLHTEAGWRIVQYNLTLPLPNELFQETAREVIEFYADQDSASQP